jgi:hypothetical protein
MVRVVQVDPDGRAAELAEMGVEMASQDTLMIGLGVPEIVVTSSENDVDTEVEVIN